ncbi:MAG: FtsX-like permease family protein [Roseivirga sp.]|nr:FtsX-like permease family protein [Roseivirga sp.]
MLKNYIKVLFRGAKKQWGYLFINVAGLATGIACFILIALFVRDELTFDGFHEKGDRIHRVLAEVENPQITVQPPNGLAQVLLDEFPAVENVVRLGYEKKAISYKEQLIYEDNFFYADNSLFEVFDYNLALGNPANALESAYDLVLSEDMAAKYFPDQNPVGEILRFAGDSVDYKITGVLEEFPANSRFKFKFIASFKTPSEPNFDVNSWRSSDAVHYVLFKEGFDDYEGFLAQVKAEYEERDLTYKGVIEPFEGLYLDADYSFTMEGISGDRKTVITFSVIGILILLLACINYVNLTTAKMTVRSSEIGLRKVLGADRRQIRHQFFGETMIYVLMAVLIAAGLVEYFLPRVNALTNKGMTLDYWSNPWILMFFIGLIPVIGILAGLYPALIVSVLQPAQSLKSSALTNGKSYFRKVLVTIQFAITLTLIITSVVMKKQFDHFMDFKGGLDKDQVVLMGSGQIIKEKYDLLKSEFGKVPGVASIIGGPFASTGGYFPLQPDVTKDENIFINAMWVTPNYISTMGIELVAGRDFIEGSEPDFQTALIINEALVKELQLENPIGTKVKTVNDQFQFTERTIIGVAKDFTFNAKRGKELVLLQPSRGFYEMSVKIGGTDISKTLDGLRDAWAGINPDKPFEPRFLDERVANFYNKESRLSQLFGIFSGLAVLIAALGLIGLSTYTAARKSKEIGVRKVLGATLYQVLRVLSQGYMVLVAIAFLVAAPVSYFFVRNWLDDFPNRINISVTHFGTSILITILVVIVAISLQSIKAARQSPVDLLRDE